MIDLKNLETLAKAATPGPWEPNRLDGSSVFHTDVENVTHHIASCFDEQSKDAAFIAAANPSVVLGLITELRQTRKERNWIAQRIVSHHDTCAHPVTLDGCPPCEAECVKCWLNAAREAVETRKESTP